MTFILAFLVSSAFWAWVVFGEGAERLEGTFASGFLVWHSAPEWPSAAIRLFAIGCWTLHALWFALGLLVPAVRPFAS